MIGFDFVFSENFNMHSIISKEDIKTLSKCIDNVISKNDKFSYLKERIFITKNINNKYSRRFSIPRNNFRLFPDFQTLISTPEEKCNDGDYYGDYSNMEKNPNNIILFSNLNYVTCLYIQRMEEESNGGIRNNITKYLGGNLFTKKQINQYNIDKHL